MALDADKKPVLFSRADAVRLQKMLRDYERGYRNETPPRGNARGKGGGARSAKSTTAITAASGNTPGIGTIEYYDVPESGAATPTSVTDTVRNWGGAIASGRMLLVIPGSWGPWVVVDKCP